MTSKPREYPRLAIVIPAFNAAATIGETLQSVCGCRHLDKVTSVFVCDDASLDSTADVARKTLAGRMPLQVWTNHYNIGEQATLNKAFLELQKSFDWVYLIHADDLAKPNWIELYLGRISEAGPKVVTISSGWDTWFADTNLLVPGEDDFSRDFQIVEGNREAVVGTLARGCWWRNSGCVINLKRFLEVGKFRVDLPIVFDLEWALRCLRSGYSIEFIPRTSVIYRQHSNSKSSESSRVGKDLSELLSLYKMYFNDGFLSATAWKAMRRRTLYAAAKRVVRGLVRGDILGIIGCSKLAASTIFPSRIASDHGD
jgi:glycosyltransferase involved in cell wall biosynthesis